MGVDDLPSKFLISLVFQGLKVIARKDFLETKYVRSTMNSSWSNPKLFKRYAVTEWFGQRLDFIVSKLVDFSVAENLCIQLKSLDSWIHPYCLEGTWACCRRATVWGKEQESHVHVILVTFCISTNQEASAWVCWHQACMSERPIRTYTQNN